MPFIMFFSVYIKAILFFFYLQSSEVHGEDGTCEYFKLAFMVLVREWDGMRGYGSELVHFNLCTKCWEDNSASRRRVRSFIKFLSLDLRFDLPAAVSLKIRVNW